MAGALAVIAFNFDGLVLGAAVLFGDKRPALLRDARWNEPASAQQFHRRFPAGTDEAALLEWLQANRFAVEPAIGRAHRLIESLPCGEAVEVSWRSDDESKLLNAAVTVAEAGCL